MRYIKSVFFLLVSLCLPVLMLIIVKPTWAYDIPSTPERYVNDYAQVLSDGVTQSLETKIASLSAQPNGAEIAVVTLPSLNGETVEDVSQQFFDTWKIGKAKQDNGLLLLVAVQDHQVRIQTGYGTEAIITDSTAGRIIRQDITPAFKENNYDQGITNGVNTLISYVEDPSSIPEDTSLSAVDESFLFGFFIAAVFVGISGLSYFVAFLGRSKSWWPGGLVGGILGFLVASAAGFAIFGFIGLMIDYILSKNYQKWKLEKKSTAWRNTWGGFHSSSSHSSGGFSGFGGGSSGGGGASGSW